MYATRIIQNKILAGYGVNFAYTKNIANQIAGLLSDKNTDVSVITELIYSNYSSYSHQTAEHVAKQIITASR